MGEILLAMAFALAVVTLVGHGIWVLLAWIFTGGKGARKSRDHASLCQHCRSPLVHGETVCRICDWPHPSTSADKELVIAQLMEAQLDRFEQLGLLDREGRKSLALRLAAEASSPRGRELVKPPSGLEIVEPDETSDVATPLTLDETPAEGVDTEPAVAAPSATPQDRVQSYVARREAALAEAPPTPAVPTRPKREAMSKLVAAFLEENNIRWGELIGGMLIVCCSIALVLSFWAQIAERPLLKFFIFNGVVASLFAAGLYTERRWKIHTTSHGILIIAALLVPLNFLALAAFTQESPPTDILSLGGETLSLLLFAGLTYAAATILTPRAPLLLAAGVMAPSLMQLLVRRFAHSNLSWPLLLALAAMPIGSYLVVTGTDLTRRWRAKRFRPRTINSLFILLGVVTFAVLLPLGLLTFKTGAIYETLHRLAPLVPLLGLPALATGLLFWKRMTRRELAGLRTAGMSVGVAGALMMATALALAWPDPYLLLPVTCLIATLFALVALGFNLPPAHVVTTLCAAGGWLVAFHLFRGDLAWDLVSGADLVTPMLSAISGQALVPLTALLGLAAALLLRMNRPHDSWWYGLAAAIAAILSIALVTWFGFARAGDPGGATWIYLFYSLATLAAALLLDRKELTWVGSVLLLAALVQGLAYRFTDLLELEQPWVVALLAHATIALLGPFALSPWIGKKAPKAQTTLIESAQASSAAAALLAVVLFRQTSSSWLASFGVWLAGLWLVLALLRRSPAWFTAFQAALAVAVTWTVTSFLEKETWFVQANYPGLDPWFLQAVGIALAGYCLLWIGVRLGTRGSNFAGELLNRRWLTFDRGLEIALFVVFGLFAIYAAVPGIAQELAPIEQPATAAGALREVPAASQFAFPAIPHDHASGNGMWALLGVVGMTLVVGLWESRAVMRMLGLLLLAGLACPLVASLWESDVAVASALRWCMAAVVLIGSAVVWNRHKLRSKMQRLGIHLSDGPWSDHPASAARTVIVALVVLPYLVMAGYIGIAAIRQAGVPTGMEPMLGGLAILFIVAAVASLAMRRASSDTWWHAHGSLMLLWLGAAPLLIAAAFVVAAALRQHPLVGPEMESWFRTAGWSISYGTPLVLIAIALVGHAIRERSSHYAFAAGLLAHVIATLVFLLELTRAEKSLDLVAWIQVAQVNAIVAGVVALCWLGAVQWYQRGRHASWPTLLGAQAAIAVALCALFILPSAAALVINPAPAVWIVAAGDWLGWAALGITVTALLWIANRPTRLLSMTTLGGASTLLVSMAALTATHWDTGNWLAYHTLIAGCTLAAWVLGMRATPWAIFFGAATVGLALRSLFGDPAAPAWAIWPTATISLLAAWLTWQTARRGLMWISALLAMLATSIWWLETGTNLTATRGFGVVFEFCFANLVALSLAAIASVVMERLRIMPFPKVVSKQRVVPFHRIAVWFGALVLFFITGASLLGDLERSPVSVHELFKWSAFALLLVAAVARFWDQSVRFGLPCLYLLGLIAGGMFLDSINVDPRNFTWSATLMLGAFTLLTSYLWSRRQEFRPLAALWEIPVADTADGDRATWLIVCNGCLAALVTGLVFWIVSVNDDFRQRMVSAYAIVAVGIAIGLLARGARRSTLQRVALLLGALFAVAFGWAWLPPDLPAFWLHRLVTAVVSLAAVIALYSFGLVKMFKRANEWTRAAQQLAPLLVVAGMVLVLIALGIEVAYYVDTGEVPIQWPTLVALAAALLGLAFASLAAALLPGRDPLALSQRGRTAYVYAAEVLLGLLFLHIRVTMPWLFSGWFLRLWPLIVVGIAFLGVGLSEWFRRRRQDVLSQPLENTGALLPLLPVFGFWMVPHQINYSFLLLSVGALYGLLAVLRKSYGYGMFALLAANGSLWRLLSTTDGLGLAQHPQLWLIPPAICVLAAAHLNRKQLTGEQHTAIRYVSAIVIYVSSTAEIFINGVAEAPWLPLVLGVISLVGIFTGILLRVRAFLYLGTAFLLVALLTIIWYAALDHAWIWWASGIVTGILIIALFGLFEKKRDDVLRLVDQVKQWEA